MKILNLITVFFSAIIVAQSSYEKIMDDAMDLLKSKNKEEAFAFFEELAETDKTHWEPAYNVAFNATMLAPRFKSRTKFYDQIEKAQYFLDKAKSISPNNPDIILLQALLNFKLVNYVPVKYNEKLLNKISEIYAKAKKDFPDNSRVNLALNNYKFGIESNLTGTKVGGYFKCGKEIKRTIQLFEKEKPVKYIPKYYTKKKAKKLLKKCLKIYKK